MQALLADLRGEPWVAAAVGELRAVLADVADTLAAGLDARADAPSCEAVVAALWQRAEQGVGWTEPFWREAYVCACIAAAVTLCTSSATACDHQRALRHLDCAFIMGGPSEVLQPFVAAVEPLVPRAAALDSHLLPRSLPEGAAPEPQPSVALCRLESGEWGRFRKEFYNADVPCLLAGIAAAWPALEKWRDLGWWNTQFGHRYVPLEVGKHTDGAEWREEVVPMRDFLAALAADTRVLYLAQHPLFEHLPALRADFEVPECVGRRLTRTNAWLGSRGTVTPLHYDRRVAFFRGCLAHARILTARGLQLRRYARASGFSSGLHARSVRAHLCAWLGLLTQAVGYKYVRLYPASNTPFLYRTTASWAQQRRWPDAASEPGDSAPRDDAARQGTISLVDVEHPDLERFPLFEQARFMETVLVRSFVLGRQTRLLTGCPTRRAPVTRSSSRPGAGTSSRACRCQQASALSSEDEAPARTRKDHAPSLNESLMSA